MRRSAGSTRERATSSWSRSPSSCLAAGCSETAPLAGASVEERGTMRIRLSGLLLLGAFAALGAESTNLAPEEVIKKFAAKEAEFAKARENYTYRQTVKIQELS